MMKVVSWNCRGLGSKLKMDSVRDLIQTEQPGILLIQKSKIEDKRALELCNL